MVFTLQRYIFRDLFRVFLLSAVGMTMILSLGAILRPIQDYGAGPGQVVVLLGCFVPITMTFTLPMAAVFASALVYGRFAHDNELSACKASGISILTLINPGLFLGIVVSITTLILSFYIVPYYVQQAERAIKADAKQIFFRNIKRKGFYALPGKNYRVYADFADTASDQLWGVVIVQNQRFSIEKLISAERAVIKFDPNEENNRVTVVAHEVYELDPEGRQGYGGKLPITGEMPALLSDDIKFKRLEDIKQIREDLMEFGPIEELANQAYVQLSVELLSEEINEKISDPGQSYYRALSSRDRTVIFTADQCRPRSDSTIELLGNINFFEYNAITGESLGHWTCQRAVIQLQDKGDPTRLAIILYDAQSRRSDGEVELPMRHIVSNLKQPKSIRNITDAHPLALAREAPEILKDMSKHLAQMRERLIRKMRGTIAEIEAEIHSRLVLGLGGVLLVLIGLGLGIVFKGGHLLTAFGVSAIPAAVLFVSIMMGRNITKNPDAQGAPGIILMWAVLAMLALFTLLLYRKLLKS